METDISDYRLELTMRAVLPIDGDEPEQYINPVKGEIFYYDEKKNDYQLCGRIDCFFINFERMLDDGENRLLMLDDHSAELFEISQILNSEYSEKTGYLTEKTFEALEFTEDALVFNSENALYISSVEIIHKHRNQGIGMYFLDEMLNYLVRVISFGFCVVKIFPPQAAYCFSGEKVRKNSWQQKMAFGKLEKDYVKAVIKLRRLFGKTGFAVVPETEFMVCSASKILFSGDESLQTTHIDNVDYDVLEAAEIE